MRVISGQYGGRRLKTSEGPGYRPATDKVRQAIFNMLSARGLNWHGLRVGDLFAGSGSLAIEALSRGAAFAFFVEKSAKAARIIRENLSDLKVERGASKVYTGDVLSVLKKGPGKPYDCLFIDPPYGKDLLAPALAGVLDKGWLAPGGFLLAEVEQAIDPEAADVQDASPVLIRPELELLTNRLYGQTRIVLWQIAPNE